MLLDELLPIFEPLMHSLFALVDDTFHSVRQVEETTLSMASPAKNDLCVLGWRSEDCWYGKS